MHKPISLLVIDNIRFLEFPELRECGLNHLFTTSDWDMGIATNIERRGNLDKVAAQYEMLGVALNAPDKTIYFMKQEHTARVMRVPPDSTAAVEAYPFGERVQDVDGLWTDTDCVLASTYADCVPILLFDPVKLRQANIHSGWRGTAAGIVGNGIRQMAAAGSDPKDILAVIGPHIRDDEFFVREDAVQVFRAQFPDCFPSGRDSDFYRQVDEEHFTINLVAVIRKTALDLGIREDNFWLTDLSTVKEAGLLHSWRRDGHDFGLMTVASRIGGNMA